MCLRRDQAMFETSVTTMIVLRESFRSFFTFITEAEQEGTSLWNLGGVSYSALGGAGLNIWGRGGGTGYFYSFSNFSFYGRLNKIKQNCKIKSR